MVHVFCICQSFVTQPHTHTHTQAIIGRSTVIVWRNNALKLTATCKRIFSIGRAQTNRISDRLHFLNPYFKGNHSKSKQISNVFSCDIHS